MQRLSGILSPVNPRWQSPHKARSRTNRRNVLALGLASLSILLAACGSSSTTPANSVGVTGQWQITGQSEVTPGKTTILQVNLARDSVTTLFATPANVLALQQTTSLNGEVLLNSVGFACDNDSLNNNAFNATFTTGTAANFMITDNGALGYESPTGNFVFNAAGTQIASGSYSVPPACGAPQDSGFVTGTIIAPFTGTYAGTFNSGADSLIVAITEDVSNYSVQLTGTENGAPISLSGRAIGGAFLVDGQGPTGPLSLLGVYNPAGRLFLIYDTTTIDFLGQLAPGTKP